MLMTLFFLLQVYQEYECRLRTFPSDLVPHIPDNTHKCPNGEDWDQRDPVERGWLEDSATIYTDSASFTHILKDGIHHPIQGSIKVLNIGIIRGGQGHCGHAVRHWNSYEMV